MRGKLPNTMVEFLKYVRLVYFDVQQPKWSALCPCWYCNLHLNNTSCFQFTRLSNRPAPSYASTSNYKFYVPMKPMLVHCVWATHPFSHLLDTPTGQLPVLEVNGKQIAQSNAIARYLAREHGMYDGKDSFRSSILTAKPFCVTFSWLFKT